MPPPVVNIRTFRSNGYKCPGVYIGRSHPRAGLAGSIWGNPFRVGVDRDLDQCLALYRAYVLERPFLLGRLDILARSAALACWCHPNPCHGDVLVDLITHPPEPLPPGVRRLEITGWNPAGLNAITKDKIRAGIRLKKADKELVAMEAIKQATPRATGRRRVDTLIILEPGQRACDPDAYFKSSLDALKNAGLLKGDSDKWVDFSKPRFVRSVEKSTVFTLTDL